MLHRRAIEQIARESLRDIEPHYRYIQFSMPIALGWIFIREARFGARGVPGCAFYLGFSMMRTKQTICIGH
jgi:hypothetical protein